VQTHTIFDIHVYFLIQLYVSIKVNIFETYTIIKYLYEKVNIPTKC